MIPEIERIISMYDDPSYSKLDIMRAIRSLSRKEVNDKSFGLLIRNLLETLEDRDLI